MKTKATIGALALAAALCLGLAACGGASPEDYTANFAGTWELDSIQSSENASTPEDIAMMKELGLVCTLDLATDGTATLDLFGDATNGTWEATGADTASITLNDEAVNIVLADDMLTLEQGGDDKLVFSKGSSDTSGTADVSDAGTDADAGEEAAEDAADDATEEAPAEETAEEVSSDEAA